MASGRWQVRVSTGVGVGQRRRVSYYAKNRADAIKILAQHNLGVRPNGTGGETVEHFLNRWLTDHVAKTKRASTLQNHEAAVRLHILPVIGDRLLTDIKPGDIDTLLDGVTSSRTTASGKSLRPGVRATMGGAWAWATKSQRIPGVENVVAMTYGRPVEERETTWLDPEQVRRFIDAVAGDPNEAFYVTAVMCGLRFSELRGLRWRDVELRGPRPQLRVAKQLDEHGLRDLKTKKSKRIIALDPIVVKALDAQRKRQQEEQQQAEVWLDQHGGLVLTGPLGTPLAGTQLRAKFEKILQDAGLPTIRLHDLRHSCASYLLGKGVPIHVVSAMLGHSRVSTTLDIYSHCLPAQQHDAVTAAWATL
jgi:integrase